MPKPSPAPATAKAFAPGTLANYWSRSQGELMPVKVKKYFAKDNRYELYHASPPYHLFKKSADAGRIQLQEVSTRSPSVESSVAPPLQVASALGPMAAAAAAARPRGASAGGGGVHGPSRVLQAMARGGLRGEAQPSLSIMLPYHRSPASEGEEPTMARGVQTVCAQISGAGKQCVSTPWCTQVYLGEV